MSKQKGTQLRKDTRNREGESAGAERVRTHKQREEGAEFTLKWGAL